MLECRWALQFGAGTCEKSKTEQTDALGSWGNSGTGKTTLRLQNINKFYWIQAVDRNGIGFFYPQDDSLINSARVWCKQEANVPNNWTVLTSFWICSEFIL